MLVEDRAISNRQTDTLVAAVEALRQLAADSWALDSGLDKAHGVGGDQ